MKKLFLPIAVLFLGFTANCQNVFYVNDNSTAGDVFTTALGSNANAGTADAPFATLQYAVTTAAANDIIYADAGSYAEQVIINKGITIIGAGQTLTFFTPPATTLIPAPGPFTEIGLFETTQGIDDVHISNLSINSNGNSQNIIIQSGGSVKNCTLLNGQQGIFFRVDPNIKSALIENNIIEAGIGINCQGSGLTATIRNNTISKPAGYYAGIFAGLDFGPLPQLTIQNNIINNYFGEGILAASFNGTYTLNSITGTGTNAINRNGNGGNTPIATCNWFGTSNAATIASKIVGTVIYSPFLAIGTDGSSNVGYQPVGSCGTGNTYYVNDGSTTSDIFTTASGNDGNIGTATAPFGTLQHAVNTAAANDIIYVDAGTYTEQVTITKGITIIGAGQNVTSILKPAVVAAPPVGSSSFNDRGVIQTAQNIGDVNIKDLSVTGGLNPDVAPIIIQSVGSVRNCKLQSGNQGLFVRIDANTNPGAKTFYIEGNTIQAEYIAVNVEGPSLHAILSNNTISAFNPGFSVGIFAGMDFGILSRITATNNLFSNYLTSGIWVNANNASITQNAFIGVETSAINRTGGANVNANCNWYGTSNASTIVLKINAGVNYYPWYLDGTDQSAVGGFQHTTESCSASTNVYYVNDNSTTGDIFTTTIGNDAYTGTSPTSPLATFGAALTKASTGATIYFDAGTYTAQTVTIGKSVTVIGTNYHVSPNDAANPLLLNSIRNAESIIDNSTLTIGADGISITGLTFTPTGNAVVLNNTSFGNFNLSRNRVRINSLFPAFFFNGLSTVTTVSQIVNWGLTIFDNRFEKEDASSGVTIRVNRFGSVNIGANTFVITGTTPRTQTCMVLGNAGIVAYVSVYNNIFDKVGTGIGGNTWNYTNINTNKFINTGTAFNINNSYPESADVLFNNNILDGSDGIFPFVQYTRQGGNTAGAKSSFTAEGNTITGSAVSGTTTLLGSMNLIFNNSVLNPSLTVRNNKIIYSGNLSTVEGQNIRPIMLRGNLKNAIVEKNEITLNGTNLQPGNPSVILPDCPAITLYPDNGTTSFLQSGSVINILNNKINGFKQSFAAYDDRASNDAFIGYGNIPAGVNVNVNDNSFTDDSISINNGTVGQPVLATCNWYGSSDAAIVVPKISGIATYSPWLTNGTDNEAATGFQPVPNSCNGRQNKFYVNDADIAGDVFTTAVGNDANSGVPSSPLATITAALTKAQAGDTIFVDGGNYTEAVTATKDITIRGAGMGITILNGPTAHITPPAGTNESGIIQSTAGVTNVIIENMTIDGSVSDEGHGTFIQGGGRISNCELRYVNDGFYFQYLSTEERTALGNNNYVHHINYVGALFAGNGLNATATNNVIDLTGALYGIGYIAGYGGSGNVASFTALNNTIIKFNGFGIMVGSLQTAQIHNNSITRITGNYFENRHTVNVDATCNWFGTANAGVITPNVLGAITYSPWLSNGTDSDLVSNGFQPLPNICNGTPVTVVLDNSNNITCNGANNGTINTTVSNGLAPYNFLWAKSANPEFSSSNEDLTNLAAGTYQLLLTDANGSTASLSGIVISEPDLLTAVASGTNNLCFGETIGTASVIGSGGTAPYTYLWNNGATTDGISNLTAGTYSVTVTDANGCTKIATYDVTQPALLTASIANNSTACSNNAAVNAVGGTPGYTYLWSNGATTASINSVPIGTYNVTVTDANQCSTTASITLTVGGAFNPSASVTNVSCFGTSNGSITVTNANGSAPFKFSIDGLTFLSGTFPYSFNSLPAGVYNIAVRDANGCTGFVTKTITQPPLLSATINIVQSTCSGQSTGAISITTTGGSGALSYSWTGTGSYISNQKNISGLATGSYSLIVTDKNGCTASLNVNVPTYNLINVSASVTNVLCRGSLTGAINLTVSGGSGSGFTYSWTGGTISTSEDISNLGASTNYNVRITDIGSGCFLNKTFAVTQPNAALSLAATKTNATGCGGSLGTITATASGGTSPYKYSIDGINYQDINIFSGLLAGSFTVWIKDANGCNTSKVVAITDNGSDQYESNNSKSQAKLITVGTTINARIALATDTADWFKFVTPTGNGNYKLNITHPTVNYTFNMYPSANNAVALVPTSSTSTSKQYALTGGTTYYVQIAGALSYTCYDLSVSPVVGFAKISPENTKVIVVNELTVKAYPNPHQGLFNLAIISPIDGKAQIELFTILGQLLAKREVSIEKGQNKIIEFNDVGRGIILYHITIGNQEVNGKVYGKVYGKD